jgi:hypothetical protein
MIVAVWGKNNNCRTSVIVIMPRIVHWDNYRYIIDYTYAKLHDGT